MVIDIIHNSFLLSDSQKIYLIDRVKNSSEAYADRLLKNLQAENTFMLQLLQKYKTDSKNTSIWQLKWELMQKNFEKIRALEASEDDDLFDLDKNLWEVL